MGNIDLISEHHIDVIEKRAQELKKEFPDKRVIISISGQEKESWQELAKRASGAGADLIECSFSCPQGTLGLASGAMLGQDPVASAKVTDWIKEAAGVTPVIIKLTPQVADIANMARAVKGAGADAICVGNTVPALMGIDIESFTPRPDVNGKSTYSGLSGPAVRPISLRCIAEISKHVGMPIAGSGGAVTWRDAFEFILAGAGVVEFCTAVMHYGFDIIDDLIEGLAFHLDRRGIASIGGLQGAALKNIVSHDELPRDKKWRPCVDENACVRCDMCMITCRDGGHKAIKIGEKRLPAVDDEKCVGCALCAAMCPVYAIKKRES